MKKTISDDLGRKINLLYGGKRKKFSKCYLARSSSNLLFLA